MTQENGGLFEFANNINTVDFILKTNEYLIDSIGDYPFIRLSQTLSDFFVIGYVESDDVGKLSELLGTNFYNSLPYVMGLQGRAELEAAGIIQIQEQTLLELRGQGVLVGIVDTGINYTDPIFRYEDGSTRIVSIFDQSQNGTPPDGFFIGSEYTRAQIDEALASDDPYSVVPQRDEVGHGTFLASVSAGRGEDALLGAAPDSELIIVKLKNARPYYRSLYLIPDSQQNVYESTAVMLGIEYIIRKAKELNRPVAICIGVGTNQGSHDGYSPFEQYISIVANITGVCICLPAGNESQARHHARLTIPNAGDTAELAIATENNGSGIYMSILGGPADRISLSIRSPTGEVIGKIPAKSGTVFTTGLVLERSKVTVEYYFPLTERSGQVAIVKIENATPGIWTVTLYGDIILGGTVDAYLPLTDVGYADVEFVSPDPNYTVTVPGTSVTPITCAAYSSSDNRLYINSSWGPTRTPLPSPDFAAPGVRVSGAYPWGVGVMSGTSVATAISAGACALMLEWGIVEGNYSSLNTFQIKELLIRGCIREPGVEYPNSQWGYGKLNLYNTFNLLRQPPG